jgi:hypothetical protein
MMDLRDVVHGRHTRVELAEGAEQLVDVDVLRAIDRCEPLQDELEVSRVSARRVRPVVDQDAVGQKASQRRLELVMVGVNEARHHDASRRIDFRGTVGAQIRSHREDLRPFDQHIGLWKIADLRIHRHHGAAADDQAPARAPIIVGRAAAAVRLRNARREQIHRTCCRRRGRRRFQEVPARIAGRMWVILRLAFIAQFAHARFPPG